MAYNRHNKLKAFQHIKEIYNEVKQEDIPDTYIVRVIFPKHKIYISIRTWVTIKGMKPSEFETNQMSLF